MEKIDPTTGEIFDQDIKPPFVRNPYNYDTVRASNRGALECKDEHRTQQQFAEESDINFIADRFGLNDNPIPEGYLVEPGQPLPSFANFEGIFDFQTANNQLVEAKNAFMSLPAKVRTRFSNDPHQYIQFLQDPENTDEAIKLGLATKRVQDAPQSPQGDAGTKSKGDTPSPKGEAPAKPATPPNTST